MGWYHSADWDDFVAEQKKEQAATDAAAAAAAATLKPTTTTTTATPSSYGTTPCALPPDATPPPPPPDVEAIYHLCQKSKWDEAYFSKQPYFPPTFLTDGKFTRATIYKDDVVNAANEYYKDVPGEWICLELSAPLLYGLGIPILAQNAPESTPKAPVRCLQLFGGISTTLPGLLRKVYPMKRSANGTFLYVMDPPDCGCGPNTAGATTNTASANAGAACGMPVKKKKNRVPAGQTMKGATTTASSSTRTKTSSKVDTREQAKPEQAKSSRKVEQQKKKSWFGRMTKA